MSVRPVPIAASSVPEETRTEKQAMKGLDKKDQKALGKFLNRIESNLSNIEIEPDEPDDDAAE